MVPSRELATLFQMILGTPRLRPLNEQGAKVLCNGLMAVDTVESALFISGEIVEPDTYDFSNPCPPSAVRVANCDLVATADKSGKTPDFKTARSSSKLPDGFRVATASRSRMTTASMPTPSHSSSESADQPIDQPTSRTADQHVVSGSVPALVDVLAPEFPERSFRS